jgi:hypothetical protein
VAEKLIDFAKNTQPAYQLPRHCEGFSLKQSHP